MTTLQSFFVPAGASGTFTASVECFRGIALTGNGLLILAECRGEPQVPGKPGLIDARGNAIAVLREGEEWRVEQLFDGQAPPAGGQFLGAVAAQSPAGGRFAVWVYVSRAERDQEPK